jgi:hypothetical protein
MRHVIVEGCDGSGKSTLVDLLVNKRAMTPAIKASTSLGGPVPNLAEWVLAQEDTMNHRTTPPLVYDRHPVISELIYGPIIRGHLVSPEFDNRLWMSERLLFIEKHCLVVWCITNLENLTRNARNREDMPGVKENLAIIDEAYRARVRQYHGLAVVRDPFTQDLDAFLDLYDYYQETS